MKKVLFCMFICSVMIASCSDDFLNRSPQSELSSSGFYKTQTDMNMAVLSGYQRLRSLYNGNYYKLGEIRSDNTTYSWLAGNPINERGIDEFAQPLMESNGFLRDVWNDSYNGILRCNLVLKYIGDATFTQEPLRVQYEAEARFLRALYYFWLNRIFGGEGLDGQLLGVCQVENVITQAEAYEIGRAPLQSIYDLIVADLTFAEANLPGSYPAADKGRATKASASGLLAKVYMFMAGYPLKKGNEYYTKAIQQMDKFYGAYPEIKLATTYQHLFKSPHNQTLYTKNSVESIFEVQYKKGTSGEQCSSPWNNNFAPRFQVGVLAVGDAGGENAPTDDMSAAYEYGDPRKYVSMRDGWVNPSTSAFINDKFVCKYYDVASSSSNNDNNWIELRLADLYLLHAEALVRTGGDKSKALGFVNQIRQRARATAGNPAITDAPADLLRDYTLADFADDNALLLAIEKERRVELAFENHRWFDLVRTERAKEVMTAQQTAQFGSLKWNDDALRYPIPEQVMQSNPKKIIQNKGYTQL